MITPLIIVSILLVPLIGDYALSRERSVGAGRRGGVIGIACAFGFFGVGHFVQTEPMVEMLPACVPNRVAIIYLTGVLEWILAVGLLLPQTRRMAGWACICTLVLFFPANVYAAINAVGLGGHLWGPSYLLIRAPLQIFLIGWTFWFAVREAPREHAN